MGFEFPAGAIAVALGVISFYGMTYVVIALNTGWRFGYWIASATFGALMVMLSIFWIVNPVGPRGSDSRWLPLAAARERVAQVTFKNEPLTTPAQYPGSPWKTPKDQEIVRQRFAQRVSLAEQGDALVSAITNCLTTAPDSLGEGERRPCADAQGLMPPDDEVPVIEGSQVAVTPEAEDVRFTLEDGALLGQVTIEPTTHDPRVAKDPVKGQEMGDSFRLVAVYDKGSVRLPPFMSTILFGLYFGFHLWGLNRAEKRKLSPITL
jgi:hypothetical protein